MNQIKTKIFFEILNNVVTCCATFDSRSIHFSSLIKTIENTFMTKELINYCSSPQHSRHKGCDSSISHRTIATFFRISLPAKYSQLRSYCLSNIDWTTIVVVIILDGTLPKTELFSYSRKHPISIYQKYDFDRLESVRFKNLFGSDNNILLKPIFRSTDFVKSFSEPSLFKKEESHSLWSESDGKTIETMYNKKYSFTQEYR